MGMYQNGTTYPTAQHQPQASRLSASLFGMPLFSMRSLLLSVMERDIVSYTWGICAAVIPDSSDACAQRDTWNLRVRWWGEQARQAERWVRYGVVRRASSYSPSNACGARGGVSTGHQAPA